MLIQTREYLVVTSPFVNLLEILSWFCIIGSYLIGCVLLFFVSVLCVWCGRTPHTEDTHDGLRVASYKIISLHYVLCSYIMTQLQALV
jgi:hypothetical protein